jgi:hypothetical protein
VKTQLTRIAGSLLLVLAGACQFAPTEAVRAPEARYDGGPGSLGSGNIVTKTEGGSEGTTGVFGATSPIAAPNIPGDTATKGPGTLGSGN